MAGPTYGETAHPTSYPSSVGTFSNKVPSVQMNLTYARLS